MPMRWTAVLARMGVPTGDRRIISPGALTTRDLPLPLSYQHVSDDGHRGSTVVGRIDEIDFSDTGVVTARGSMIDASMTWEAEELIRNGVIGPSIDLDDMTYVIDDDDMVIITEARIAGATLVSIPAFPNVSITLEPEEEQAVPEGAIPVYIVASGERSQEEQDAGEVARQAAGIDGTMGDAQDVVHEFKAAADGACLLCGLDESMDRHSGALTASATTFPRPSASLFENPNLSGPMPLTVFDNDQVFGHVALWDTCHVGFEDCRTAPSSPSGYAHYMVHEEHTDAGIIPTGVISVGGGHADPQLGFVAAVQHYDDVSAQVARVVVGEDQWGIWAAGRILPWADPVKVEQFRSSPISGDWRRRGGALELIAVCSVNTPGFPIPRTRARAGFALVDGTKKMKSLQLGLGQLTRYTGTSEQFKIEQPESFTMEYDQETARAKWAWAMKGR